MFVQIASWKSLLPEFLASRLSENSKSGVFIRSKGWGVQSGVCQSFWQLSRRMFPPSLHPHTDVLHPPAGNPLSVRDDTFQPLRPLFGPISLTHLLPRIFPLHTHHLYYFTPPGNCPPTQLVSIRLLGINSLRCGPSRRWSICTSSLSTLSIICLPRSDRRFLSRQRRSNSNYSSGRVASEGRSSAAASSHPNPLNPPFSMEIRSIVPRVRVTVTLRPGPSLLPTPLLLPLPPKKSKF